jgi:hypothetical protein
MSMERVQEIAYYLWENAGRPEGKDLDFWLRGIVYSLSPIKKLPILNVHKLCRRC